MFHKPHEKLRANADRYKSANWSAQTDLMREQATVCMRVTARKKEFDLLISTISIVCEKHLLSDESVHTGPRAYDLYPCLLFDPSNYISLYTTCKSGEGNIVMRCDCTGEKH